MTGGTSKMFMVQDRVKTFFKLNDKKKRNLPKLLINEIDPLKAVCTGATYHATTLAAITANPVCEILPHTLNLIRIFQIFTDFQ